MYALACTMGFPAGCTNRAAGIRNGGYEGDPFRDAPLATKQTCEYRGFLIDCDRRGAWGCAMLGQAYRNGEGVAAQPERAKAAFEASCRINPKFAACAFAKGYLDEMDGVRRSGDRDRTARRLIRREPVSRRVKLSAVRRTR